MEPHSHDQSHMRSETCSCGHDHSHDLERDETCGCGQDHNHVHDENCGCGGHHHHEAPPVCDIFEDETLNETAGGLMRLLDLHGFLPCARFVVRSSREPDFENVALAPVFISGEDDSVLFLRAIGDILLSLAYHGYISIDYDIPLKGYDYSYFKGSAAYRLFEETVREAQTREGFLGDIADIEYGSIAPLKRDD